jgi:hypothetical protein
MPALRSAVNLGFVSLLATGSGDPPETVSRSNLNQRANGMFGEANKRLFLFVSFFHVRKEGPLATFERIFLAVGNNKRVEEARKKEEGKKKGQELNQTTRKDKAPTHSQCLIVAPTSSDDKAVEEQIPKKSATHERQHKKELKERGSENDNLRMSRTILRF